MIFVMGCSAGKAEGSVPGFAKYAARQHDLLRENLADLWAAGHAVYILSAKFGLVQAHNALPDYDEKMTPARAAELAEQVMLELKEAEEDHEEVVVYGSALYRSVIEQASDLPVYGVVGQDRGCGDHYSALKKLFDTYMI